MIGDPRRAFHLGVLVGVSAIGYAGVLAGVTNLQSANDAAVLRVRDPISATASELADGHDRLEGSVRRATDRYAALADRYDALGVPLGALEDYLDAFASLTDRITQSAAALPTRVRLPAVARAPAAKAPPTPHAVTGASGR